jgi:hypothetical protein
MFFEEVKLSKKSWHYKLMKLTWGQNTPNLWSFCPYFWLTIFNFFVLPITLVIRGFQGFINFLDRKLFIEPYERFLSEKSEDEIFIGALFDQDLPTKKIPQRSMFKKRDRWDFTRDMENYLVNKWGIDWKYSDEFQEKQREINNKYWAYTAERRKRNREIEEKKREEREAKRRKILERRETNKKKLEKYLSPIYRIGEKISSIFSNISSFFNKPDVYKIVKITKQTVSFAVVSFLILCAAYFLFLGASYLYNFFKVDMSWSWRFFFYGVKFVFVGLIILWSIVGFIWTLIKVLEKPVNLFRNWISEIDFEIPVSIEPLFKVLKAIFVAPFIFIILKPISFFVTYFKAVKNDHCPAIIWEDENN